MKLVNGWALLLAGITIVILFMALSPAPPTNGFGWDKANHAVAMTAVTVVAMLSVRPAKRAVLIGSLYALVFGVLIEIMQGLFTVNRSAEWGDLGADMVGIAVACIVLPMLKRVGRIS